MTECGIVSPETFVLATRESGYRDTAAAISELIDNSIQAGASHVRVLVRNADGATSGRHIVEVLDDGKGMSRESLRRSLQFGGSERFDDRAGLGRFGMGLPNSSLSQTRRVEVYSWRSRDVIWYTYLDVDAVANGLDREIPEAFESELPEWAAAVRGDSGTLVLWTACDRIPHKRTSTIERRLHSVLGQRYRYALWSGLKLEINGSCVDPRDPLFCHPETLAGGARPYGAPLTFSVRVPRSPQRVSLIQVRFSELPVARWSVLPVEEKRRRGIIGSPGASFVRAGREIDVSWQCFGAKRRENYDDWWRCEIRFEPDLDELFGVTHSKQTVNPTPALESILAPDLEAIARTMNRRVRGEFERLNTAIPGKAERRAHLQDALLPPIDIVPTKTPARSVPHIERQGQLSQFMYKLDARDLGNADFFDAIIEKDEIRVILNKNHPFYKTVYAPSCTNAESAHRFQLECLLLSAARGMAASGDHKRFASMLRAWSDALAAFLDPAR